MIVNAQEFVSKAAGRSTGSTSETITDERTGKQVRVNEKTFLNPDSALNAPSLFSMPRANTGEVVPKATGRIPGVPGSLSTEEAGMAGIKIPVPGPTVAGQPVGPGMPTVNAKGYVKDDDIPEERGAFSPVALKKREAGRGVLKKNQQYTNSTVAAYLSGDLEKISGPIKGTFLGELYRGLNPEIAEASEKFAAQLLGRATVSANLATDLADFQTSRISNMGLKMESSTFSPSYNSAESKLIEALMRTYSIKLSTLASSGNETQRKAALDIINDPNKLMMLSDTARAYAMTLKAMKDTGIKWSPEMPNVFQAADLGPPEKRGKFIKEKIAIPAWVIAEAKKRTSQKSEVPSFFRKSK